MNKDVIVQIIFVPMDCVCQTQADAMDWMSVEMELMRMVVETAPQISSGVVTDSVSMHMQSVTTAMIVQTSVMSLDVIFVKPPNTTAPTLCALQLHEFVMGYLTVLTEEMKLDVVSAPILHVPMDCVFQMQAGAMG